MNSPLKNNSPSVRVASNQITINLDLEKLGIFILMFMLSALTFGSLMAEGTKELAPNPSIDINGNPTHDIAALNIGNKEYQRFAEFGNMSTDARLYVHITDPTTESIYLGFSGGRDNSFGGSTINSNSPVPWEFREQKYKYYVKDPAGNIIYTSDIIDNTNENIQNYDQAINGPSAFNAGGYEADVVESSLLTTSGNYYIEFELIEPTEDRDSEDYFLLIYYWDITVAQNAAPQTGRVWSRNWGLFAINDYKFPERPFNGAFYVCAPDPADPEGAYVTKIDFNDSGFRPGGFNVTFNSYGTDSSLDKILSRKSVSGENKANAEYEIFLNDPVDICKTAEAGNISLSGVTRCDGMASYCIEYMTNKPGLINLLLDFDGDDGIYTPGTADLFMNNFVDMTQVGISQCFDWDGLDGLGNPVDDIRILLSYEQGEYHFPIYDAEYLTQGFMIERVRPANSEVPNLFYDDSNITQLPYVMGPQPPSVELEGCSTPCHNWNNYDLDANEGYGNENTINSWWFSNRIVLEEEVELPAILFCEVTGPVEICGGTESNLELIFSHTPGSSAQPGLDGDVSWTGPGLVSSSNSGATFNTGGTYTADVSWLTPTGASCLSSCSFTVNEFQVDSVKIDTTIEFGAVFEFNGVVYDATGNYDVITTDANGCDQITTICLVVDIPDVTLVCEISSSADGLCPNGEATLTLTTTHSPDTAPFPTILGVSWDGPNLLSSDESGAVVHSGGDYTATITYVNLTEDTLTTTCNYSIEAYPEYNVKVDTTVGFGEVFEANGIVYDASTVDTVSLSTVNGCDSTVVYCVVVEIPDVFLTCNLEGPAGICASDTGALTLTTSHTPANAPAPVINSVIWSGGGIVTSNDNGATVTGGFVYSAEVSYTNIAGETRVANCEISIQDYPEYAVCIDTIIEAGQVLTIDGVDYDTPGEYVNAGTTANGCDSIVTIKIIPETVLLCYDLDNCKSSDYSKFTGKLNPEFDCAEINASTVFRENPASNGHSCTEGINGSNAMCISSDESCAFNAGSEKSAVIEVAINPDQGQNVRVTSISFYERAPEEFQWIAGHEGLNNPPTLYGVRVLKNNQEIFRVEDQEATEDWTQENFRFSGIPEFIVDAPSLIRIELLGYCLKGNDSSVTAWDLDEIKINATCTSASANQVEISGSIKNIKGEPLSQVRVALDTDNPYMNSKAHFTNVNGEYAFTELRKGYEYQIKPDLNDDFLNGVTTVDLIHIQRHVLGLKSFDSPYQMIAADADNSESITAIDILQLRKLILGIYDELPRNTSYRFARTDQELPLSNPWQVDENEIFYEAEEDQLNTNFNAIKIGDVSLFADFDNNEVESRNRAQDITINTENVYAKENELIQLDLQITDEASVEGFQFALDLNDAEFVSLEGLDDNGTSYHLDVNTNTLKVSYFNSNGNDVVDFQLNLLANKSGYLSEMVALNEAVLSPTVYSGETLEDKKLNIEFNNEVLEDFISISPNPFAESFKIEMNAGQETTYTIDIFDVSGKLLYRSNNEVVNRMYTKYISKTDIANYKGVIIIKINSENSNLTKRILSL
ncbi:MAG: T9SS type A sorting domain-containing protein [Saprospiraceae bacterium]|nr:T9SS type A sorting domain-containing protein [Saprospiraceae bacterium]